MNENAAAESHHDGWQARVNFTERRQPDRERAAEELKIKQLKKRLEKDAQRLNDLVSGAFVVTRAAEGEWADKTYGSRHAREDRVDMRCFIKRAGLAPTHPEAGASNLRGRAPSKRASELTESVAQELCNYKVFPHPFIRFVPWPEGPHGALPDHVMLSSTSAARNGEFFTAFDVCAAIEESMNLWHEGSPRASCDLHLNRLSSIELFTEPATIWDLTPPERDPVPNMPRMVECREKVFAFAMGLHPRLGAQAGMSGLDPESLRHISKIVLSTETEAARASIPIFCTTWHNRPWHPPPTPSCGDPSDSGSEWEEQEESDEYGSEKWGFEEDV
ncbi:hypothetical protein T484DRAFT_1752310 [Baffinella frigidus]|nr:hypothetical protein T484DRAFT_1752310 [Cryptophyta sp. CCMP2293]